MLQSNKNCETLTDLSNEKEYHEKAIETLIEEICDHASRISEINDILELHIKDYSLLRGIEGIYTSLD